MARAIYTAKQFIDAIPGSAGIITTIAQRVGCDWHTAKKHIEKHPTVMQAYVDETEKIGDLAETQLFKQIRKGDSWAIKFYLATKGRRRGYAEKGADTTWLMNVNVGDLTDDQLQRLSDGEDPVVVLGGAPRKR